MRASRERLLTWLWSPLRTPTASTAFRRGGPREGTGNRLWGQGAGLAVSPEAARAVLLALDLSTIIKRDWSQTRTGLVSGLNGEHGAGRIQQNSLSVRAENQLADRSTTTQANHDQIAVNLIGHGDQILGRFVATHQLAHL